jgi:DNA-binding NtrC family response regulator
MLSKRQYCGPEDNFALNLRDEQLEATVRLERKMVVEDLYQTGGNRSRAARILGLTRQGLLNKIARYEINL